MNLGWKTDAACLDGAISDFVPDDRDYRAAARAKAVCAGCPVARQCLEFGESNPHTRKNGIFGGMTADQRKKARRRKGKAA